MKPEEVLEALRSGKEVEYSYQGGYWVIYNQASPVGVLTSGEYSFRTKEMVTIGNVSFPKPETKKPNMDSKYYSPLLGDISKGYIELTWEDDAIDNISLTQGFVHLSKDNAIAHAKALIEASGGTYGYKGLIITEMDMITWV